MKYSHVEPREKLRVIDCIGGICILYVSLSAHQQIIRPSYSRESV